MWNEPSKERLDKVPKLYATEGIPVQDKEIHLHFFIGGTDYYISEFDGEDIMFGFCILNNDLEMAEWGYISLAELREIKVKGWLEVDCELEEYWTVKTAKEVKQIADACGWVTETQKGDEDDYADQSFNKHYGFSGEDISGRNTGNGLSCLRSNHHN